MGMILTGGNVYTPQGFVRADVAIDGGRIVCVGSGHGVCGFDVVSVDNMYIIPGLADVHVHLREPGFSYKETIASGTQAAAAGGYTRVCAMPNLNPPPDCEEGLREQLRIIAETAVIGVHPYGCMTMGRRGGGKPVDMDKLKMLGAVAFSDDGSGVQLRKDMLEAMRRAAQCKVLLAAHCEDEEMLHGGYIHDGSYARRHGHKGISSRSEWGQLERDLELVEETGCSYHMCHLSTAQSLELIRKAKAQGLDVTCETAPHYLLLCDEDMQEDGRFKMNPPLRSGSDRDALREGVRDGTIDMIATDHAPHSAEEKNRGLEGSAMGVVGLETAFAALYTGLVRQGVISLERLVELMAVNPRKRFGLPGGVIAQGEPAELAVFDLDTRYTVNAAAMLSMGKATPFDGAELYGKNRLTIYNGRTVYEQRL